MPSEEMKKNLKTKIQSAGKTANNTTRRKLNINFIKELDRDGLQYEEKEKLLHIKTTEAGEEIFIQYPGKESDNDDKDKIKPWDFRPKILLSKENKNRPEEKLQLVNTKSGGELIFYKDREFRHLWQTTFEVLQECEKKQEEIGRLLAIILYRMAFLVDTELPEGPINTDVEYLKYQGNNGAVEKCSSTEELNPWHKYTPPKAALEELKNFLPVKKISGISLEAFLYYNHLLAWNEDCKYFYRNKQNSKGWINKTGRINTLLTLISIIGFVIGDIKLSQLLMKFVWGRGVGAAKNKEIREICDDYIIE